MILAIAILAIPQGLESPYPDTQAQDEVVAELAKQGVGLDFEKGVIELSASVCQIQEPLEYLIVKQRGKDHEALFILDEGISAAALNMGLILLGAKKGENGRLVQKDPIPTREEYEAGVPLYDVSHARGDGFYIYAGWERELPAVDGQESETEKFFFRAEDLVINSRRGDTYRRGKFVYLGSRFVKPHKDAKELFAADAEGNLVSLVYFDPANHLLTGSDPEADDQYVWYPNSWLLPAIGTPVKLWLSRKPLLTQPK